MLRGARVHGHEGLLRRPDFIGAPRNDMFTASLRAQRGNLLHVSERLLQGFALRNDRKWRDKG